MDIIYLHDLKIECVIGIWEWERRIKQTIILDLEMAADTRRAAATDRIDDTLNYKAVAKRVLDFVGNSQFQLVETLAEKVAEIMLTEFRLKCAGFFDNGFGGAQGTRAVLEVRPHDVPFRIEHGQVFFKLLYERLTERPASSASR